MQSKVIIASTVLLISVPAVYFFFCEFSDMNVGGRIFNSLFQAVTPRTAGFNTADLTALSSSGKGITILLMLIGGSPGSTAGGMKTTTAAVMIYAAISVFRHRESAVCFGRRISNDIALRAATIITMYVLLFFVGGVVISSIEGITLGDCLFETASAIGTVGLTLGITPTLGGFSRIILIGLMFFGRVGGLTLIFAASSNKSKVNSKLPQEKITVG